MTRFEGLFLVATCTLLLLMRRSFLLAASILAAAALPVTVYGLLALAHGWFFLPNSVMLKGAGMGTTWFSSLVTVMFRHTRCLDFYFMGDQNVPAMVSRQNPSLAQFAHPDRACDIGRCWPDLPL